MHTYKKLELMAPVGSLESLEAAINSGADSIYFGLDQLNMRARSAKNFYISDIPYIVKKCNYNNIRTYLTINTIIYDHDFFLIKKIANNAKKFGIDAIIAMDQSIINYAKSIDLKVHISTQLNITNIESIKFYSFFSDTIVLSRELSLIQIKNIISNIKKKNIIGPSGNLIKIEIFCHGALCMAISGKCYLSLHSYNSSANRGSCKQNCRKKYTLIDKDNGFSIDVDNEYLMSSKDLCTINFLDKIIDTGISLLKIEGRARSPEYVANTTSCYREAIDYILNNKKITKSKINFWVKKLNSVYNRGFYSGYYLGKTIKEWSNKGDYFYTNKKIYLGKVKKFYKKSMIGEFIIESFNLKLNDNIYIIGTNTGLKKTNVKSLMVNDIKTNLALKGDICTFPINFNIKLSDKLYKIIEN
ncbi:peptidase U32 family protein [Candidatus Karelsulcia muelleri]|uniref:U32 family peptidase n=1 Tax=Candidatus Karelsulcia muelleri PSPU TaxID=1189303 RepID=A0AAD1EX82_9FLAO|nr:peptidase U32 family protein [Candidatus Karelsulcia muelleri]NJJ98805.1 U32 family peptidase [Candidatus Karelsulcia muelleri]BAO66205.1 U32 family peptidase [Candidatus Karelsulcia muelleri PSPU]